MKPQPSRSAIAPPRIKPRASMPATASMGCVAEGLGHLGDGRLEALGIAEKRRDVAEHDAGLGIVRDRTDQALQISQDHLHVKIVRQGSKFSVSAVDSRGHVIVGFFQLQADWSRIFRGPLRSVDGPDRA